MLKTQKQGNVYSSLQEVYKNRSNIIITIVIGILFAFIISFIQNVGQVIQIYSYQASFTSKIVLIFAVLVNLYTDNLSLFNLCTHLLLIVLLSINITVAIFYFKKRGLVVGQSGTIISTIFGIFGTGCLACGGLVITSLVSTLGIVSGLTLLAILAPWFIILAIIILVYSIYKTLEKIGVPFVC